jgi:hypothetical protein
MESIRASLAEGGSSRKDLDDFVAYIARWNAYFTISSLVSFEFSWWIDMT